MYTDSKSQNPLEEPWMILFDHKTFLYHPLLVETCRCKWEYDKSVWFLENSNKINLPVGQMVLNILLSRYLGYLWFVLMLYNCYPKLDQENVQRYISKVIFQGLSHGFSMNILIFLAQYPGFSVVFISFSVFLCTYSINPTEWGQSNFRGGLN